VAALHDVDHEKVRLTVVLGYVEERGIAEKDALRRYQRGYRKLRDIALGEEIRNVGATRWAEIVPGTWEH
jgi:hypothetical protein